MTAPSNRISKAIRAFGHFWLDFLVGDTPEIFLGSLVVVAAALVFRHDRPVGIVLVLALTIMLLVASAYRGRSRQAPPDQPDTAGGPVRHP